MFNRKLLLLLATAAMCAPAVQAADDARVRGTVLQAAGDVVTIDVGRDAGVKERTVYDVFVDARSVKLPMTNEVVYVPQKVVAQLVVVAVEAKTAQAKVMPNAGGELPRVDRGALVVSNPLSAPRNIAPFVKTIVATPARTEFGTPVTVKLEWSDEKEDRVYFDWSCSGGVLSHPRSAVPTVVWTPPVVKEKGKFTVTVNGVDTGGNKSAKSIEIEVGPPTTLKSVYEVRRTLADHAKPFRICRDLAFDDQNTAYVVDNDAYRVVAMDHLWLEVNRSDERTQDFKQLDRIVVTGSLTAGDAYLTDLYAKRAVRLRVGPKIYQDPPVVVYGAEGTGNGQFQMPVDIAVDAKGDVYVLDQVRGCVQIFAGDGRFVASIGSLGPNEGQVQKPVALALAHDGTLYVLDDGRKRVLVFKDRRFVLEFEAGAQSDQLADVKVCPMTGRVCVLDSKAGQVRTFDATGKAIGSPFGAAGEALAMNTFYRPTRLKFDRLGSLYILAGEGHVLHRCDPVAGEVARWGGIKFSNATKIAAAPNGDLAVLIPSLYVVANLDRRGWIRGLCGGEGTTPGKLADPIAVAVDAKGNVAVLDVKQRQIQLFSSSGEALRVIGAPGKAPNQIQAPIDMSIDPTRRYLVTLEERDDHAVKVFDLQAASGAELRAAFPGIEVESVRCVAATPTFVHVGCKGGDVHPFKLQAVFDSKSQLIDASNALSAGPAWKLKDDITKPTSMAISNISLLFTANPGDGFVQVVDLSRSGAVVTKIADAKAVKTPAVATVDDFDRVFIWDTDAGRAVEFGR